MNSNIDVMEYLEQEGFCREDYGYLNYNAEDKTIEKALREWASIAKVDSYDMDADCVFESPGLDITCYAFAYAKNKIVFSYLFTAYNS